MRNKFLLTTILNLCLLSGFAMAEPDNSVQPPNALAQQTVTTQQQLQQPVADSAQQPAQSVTPQGNATDDTAMSIPEKNMNRLKNIGRNTPQNRFLKFLISMIGVVISGLAVYGGLKLYKKFVIKDGVLGINSNDERNLESPKDFKTAINIFLKKTDI